jgi:ribosomal protein S18 acetylase RimI-like enzyme
VSRIEPLTVLDPADLRRLATGYTATEKYIALKKETIEQTMISLVRVKLNEPYVKHFQWDEVDWDEYRRVIAEGFSLGAFIEDELVGLALASARHWNQTLWVWEFHVGEPHRGKGIGRQLAGQLVERARAARLRAVVCETQNTNTPEIDFYRRVGFRVDAIDLSYYTNRDTREGGEVAVFMKRKLR